MTFKAEATIDLFLKLHNVDRLMPNVEVYYAEILSLNVYQGPLESYMRERFNKKNGRIPSLSYFVAPFKCGMMKGALRFGKWLDLKCEVWEFGRDLEKILGQFTIWQWQGLMNIFSRPRPELLAKAREVAADGKPMQYFLACFREAKIDNDEIKMFKAREQLCDPTADAGERADKWKQR